LSGWGGEKNYLELLKLARRKRLLSWRRFWCGRGRVALRGLDVRFRSSSADDRRRGSSSNRVDAGSNGEANLFNGIWW